MTDILKEEEILNQAFIAPQREFKGEKLAPYTEGSRLLLFQTRRDDDSSIFFIWSFIYLHIILAKNREQAIRISWDKDEFRKNLFDWVLDKTEEDREKATEIAEQIIEEASMGRVESIQKNNQASLGNS